MTEEIHNLYISSSNKTSSDYNYNYNLYLSSYGIKIKEDQDAYFSINGFQTLNSFYNIDNKSKSFIVKIRTAQEINFTYNFTIDEGNYNVFEFMSVVNSLCNIYFTMEYNEKKNKWNYKSNQDINISVYLMPNIYNYKYFGLKPNVFTEILYPINNIGTYSSLINMNSFSLIVIKILGLVENNKCIDNFNTTVSRGDICAIINRQDSPVNSLINWCDINQTFKKKISNLEINQLTFLFTDEFNNELFELNDWLITLSIVIKKKN